MAQAQTTIDHEEIRKWVEARGGKPATVRSTAKEEEPGILRIDFPGYSGEDSLEEIDWEAFFDKFDESDLAFLYQDKTESGDESRFFKFIRRNES
jgi:hypothetical protein